MNLRRDELLHAHVPTIPPITKEMAEELNQYSSVKSNVSLLIRGMDMGLVGGGSVVVLVSTFTPLAIASIAAVSAGALVYFAKTAWDITEFNRKEKEGVVQFQKNLHELLEQLEKTHLEDITTYVHLLEIMKSENINLTKDEKIALQQDIEHMYAMLLQLREAVLVYYPAIQIRKNQLLSIKEENPNIFLEDHKNELKTINNFINHWEKTAEGNQSGKIKALNSSIAKLNALRDENVREKPAEEKYFKIKKIERPNLVPTTLKGKARYYGGKILNGGLSFFMGASVGATIALIFTGIFTTIAIAAIASNPITLGILIGSIVAGGVIGYAVDRHLSRNQQKKLEHLTLANAEVANITQGAKLIEAESKQLHATLNKKLSEEKTVTLKKQLETKDNALEKEIAKNNEILMKMREVEERNIALQAELAKTQQQLIALEKIEPRPTETTTGIYEKLHVDTHEMQMPSEIATSTLSNKDQVTQSMQEARKEPTEEQENEIHPNGNNRP